MMPTLAQLDGTGQVTLVFQAPDVTARGPDVTPCIDITAVVPQPDLGWTTPDGGITWLPPAPDNALANRMAVMTRVRAAYQNNQAYLALAPPTQAQAVAQITALTREVNALFKIVLDDYGTLTGT